MKTLTTAELQEMIAEQKDFQLINTLEPERFAETHIPGSINVPVSEEDFTEKLLQAIGTKQKLVVVYGASRACDASAKAAKQLEEAGFDVADYEGGATAWKDAGKPLEV